MVVVIGGGAVGTYVYVNHNGTPVVSSASVTITPKDLDKGTDTTSCTQDYSRSLDDDGVKDCDAGHILANRLGGPGNQPINIFPQVISTSDVLKIVTIDLDFISIAMVALHLTIIVGLINQSWGVCTI